MAYVCSLFMINPRVKFHVCEYIDLSPCSKETVKIDFTRLCWYFCCCYVIRKYGHNKSCMSFGSLYHNKFQDMYVNCNYVAPNSEVFTAIMLA